MLGLVTSEDPRIGRPALTVLFADGRRWYFDGDGKLLATAEAPFLVVYRRDQARRVRRIEGWYGPALRADVLIEYDEQRRIAAAVGSNGDKAGYQYGEDGRLATVVTSSENP